MISFFGTADPPQKSKAPSTPAPVTPAPKMSVPMTPMPGTPAPGTPMPSASATAPEPHDPQEQADPAGGESEMPSAPYEGIDPHMPQIRTMKPLYSLKRVLQKLPEAVKEEPATARRLLLGLHEKLWHATARDFASLLMRAGMPPEVIEMASQAVAACSICRKYSRLPSRPRTKVSLAACFGDEVELDLFFLRGKTFLIMVDVATRYKVAFMIQSKSAQDIMQGMITHWIRFFGPMRVLTGDQETAIMTTQSGIEFERLGITRNPKGTTSGLASAQHTGTGLIERHTSLVKLTMQKMKAEMDRQGLLCEDNDVAMEAAMSHNLCLTYGGYTPAMAVFGVLPRAMFEFEAETLTAVNGSMDRDVSIFESALRLRSIAMAAIQQSIAEDRIARATRSRPQKLDTAELTAGTSQLEIHRDGNWRGPATLLEVNEDEGTAVVKYQGRPYLMPLRFVRPFQGIYFNMDTNHEEIYQVMKMVEESQQYKQYFLGYKMILESHGHTMRLTPAQPREEQQKIIDSFSKWSHWLHHPVHGLLYGQALHTLQPPPGTRGTILIWLKNTTDYVKVQKEDDRHMRLKKEYHVHWDSMCTLYFLYYPIVTQEPPPVSQPASTSSAQPSAIQGDTPPEEMEVESTLPSVPSKRMEPEVRSPALVPDKKPRIYEAFPSYDTYQTLHTLHWMLDRKKMNRLRLQDFWASTMEIPRWMNGLTMEEVNVHFSCQADQVRQRHASYLVHQPGSRLRHVHLDLAHGGSYLSLTDELNIKEEELADLWPLVEEADAKELAQFVQEKAFEKVLLEDILADTVVIDGIWVRCWKYKQGKKILKSRMCARGCFDPQKQELSTRSTTASRLSQRILLSTAAVMNCLPESWDVSGAFLKGLTFDRIRELLLKQGIKTPIRSVVVIPPYNSWRHLAKVDPSFHLEPWEIPRYGLWCLKPVYGLNDAPVAWQLSLEEFLKKQKGVASHLDDSFYFWKDPA